MIQVPPWMTGRTLMSVIVKVGGTGSEGGWGISVTLFSATKSSWKSLTLVLPVPFFSVYLFLLIFQVQNLAVRNQQASAQGPQMQGSAQKAIPPGASPVSSLSQASSQTLAVAQASSGASGQSLNLSQAGGGSGSSLPGSMGPGGGGQAPGGLGQLPSSGMGGGGSCPRKGTGVVQPLPAAQTVTVSQGSQTEAESAAAKKAEADGASQQNVGMNLTRTATPAPSQTLISSGKWVTSVFPVHFFAFFRASLGPGVVEGKNVPGALIILVRERGGPVIELGRACFHQAAISLQTIALSPS